MGAGAGACGTGADSALTRLPYSERVTEPAPWQDSLRAQRFEQAAARARAQGAPPDALAALDDLARVEAGVRDKRYGAARRALARYQRGVDDGQDTLLLSVPSLDGALASLEEAERARVGEPAALRGRLAPAFAQPLTAPEAHNAVGVLQALLGEDAAARASFDAALDVDPRHYRALTNLGNLLLEGGDAAGAEGYYRRALAINGEYPGAHHNLAVALRRQRKVAASVRALKTSQRLSARQATQEGREEARARLGQLGGQLGGKGLGGRGGRTVVMVALVGLALLLLRVFGG